MSLLEVKDLTIHYLTDDGDVSAVNGISFSMEKGDTLGLVGETGAGKSTTALGIMRLVPNPPGKILRGEILFDEEDLLAKPEAEMRKIRGNKISMIFQDPMTALNPVMRVDEQVAEVVKRHSGLNKSDSLRRALDMLQTVGIPPERGGDYPHQFSGGMKQRVVIAIALACTPQLLIADEPTTALDVTIQAQVLDMMNDLKQEFGTSMILITHDLGIVAETCDKVAIMYAGKIVEYGSLRDIFKQTAHPYTIGLFNSLPPASSDVKRLKPIPGLMPDPTDLPTGCSFHPRCPFCQELCTEKAPEDKIISPGHSIRCHFYQELKEKRPVAEVGK
ncbi:MAG: ABC transporter ATP-binding protein [Clostridiales Family XIII bacterium]|jgi:peptide/nickel transport system ATP-binding protein|nr:ABC transporter ATP-binding protein [Clostridiales Family XIII bacterium]